jgi:hypothetical protein
MNRKTTKSTTTPRSTITEDTALLKTLPSAAILRCSSSPDFTARRARAQGCASAGNFVYSQLRMAPDLSELDYYALLGVAPNASADEIKAGFHAFARRFHPDRYAGDAERAAHATRIYQRGTEAYRVLTNAEQRRLYDERLGKGQLRLSPEVARRSSFRPSGAPGAPEGYAPRARPFVVRAEQALRSKDYQQAKLNLQIALQHDAGNAGLRRKLEDVDALLKPR